ncbi:MAG: hypothetical protein RIF33_14325 [Cyclobacteriaceae bacterium]
MVESKIEPRVFELLRQLEEKCNEQLVKTGEDMKEANLCKLHPDRFYGDVLGRSTAKGLDSHTNVNWPPAHYQSVGRYLCQDSIITSTTGDSNTQRHASLRCQKISFSLELWFENELEVSDPHRAIDTVEKNHA